MRSITRRSLSLLALCLTPVVTAPRASAAETPAPQPELSQQKLLESFDALAKTMNEAKQQVGTAVAERDRALQALAETRKHVDARDRQIEQLKKQLAEREKQAREWEQKSRSHEAEASELRKKVGVLEQRLAIGKEVQGRLATFRERLEKASHEFEAMESELGKIREDLKEPRKMDELVKQNQRLHAEAEQASKAIKQGREERDKTAGDLKEALRDLTVAKMKLQEAEKAREALARRSEVAMKEASEKQQAAIKRALLEANESTREMTAAKDRADELARKLRESEARTEEARNRAEGLKKELAKREEALAAAKKKLERRQERQSAGGDPAKGQERGEAEAQGPGA